MRSGGVGTAEVSSRAGGEVLGWMCGNVVGELLTSFSIAPTCLP